MELVLTLLGGLALAGVGYLLGGLDAKRRRKAHLVEERLTAILEALTTVDIVDGVHGGASRRAENN